MDRATVRLASGLALAASAALGGSAPAHAALFSAGLPAGAVVAFTPATVCDALPGGWRDFKDADGRVVVGAAAGLAASGGAAATSTGPVDYWARGVTLQPGMVPRTPVTGAGPVLATTPELTVDTHSTASIAAAFSSATPDSRLFGYQFAPPRPGGTEALAAGYGAPGAVGKQVPDPLPVAPPYIALRYCVKT